MRPESTIQNKIHTFLKMDRFQRIMRAKGISNDEDIRNILENDGESSTPSSQSTFPSSSPSTSSNYPSPFQLSVQSTLTQSQHGLAQAKKF